MSATHIIDLCYLSDTMPEIPTHVIPRDNYLDAIEWGLKDKSVFFLTGEEGVGVTTTLALFANYHHYNCVSYFNNGLTKHLLDPELIERSLIRQLYFFIDRNTILRDEDASKLDLKGLYIQLRRKMRKSNEPLYFVFDGFDEIPVQAKENIRVFMESLPWDMGKFIFSGRFEDIKEYLPSKIKCAPDQTLTKFSRYEVATFLKEIDSGLNQEDYEALCRISGCMGSQLRAMLFIYEKHKSFKYILELGNEEASDLYAFNFKSIEESTKSEISMKVLALVAFIGMRLTKDDICRVLSISIDELTEILSICSDYLIYQDNYVIFTSDCNQRYIQKRLAKLRRDMELLFIQQFKGNSSNPKLISYIPVLMKSVNDKKGLVEYLNSEVMLKNIESRKSQAALNEQCELGFSSTDFCDNSQTVSAFRFALNKSSSHEIEQNELWDYQIDALMAVGFYEKAYSLAESVYLQEERLKAFLLIARCKKFIPESLMDSVRSNIENLVSEIEFERIPEKSMEIVKLMFPYDYKIAVNIIERIAKLSDNRMPIDKLYSLLSISSGQEKDVECNAKFDVLTSKIESDDIKRMTKAVRNIFNNTNIDEILVELKELPTIQQGLYLLQYWIPANFSLDGIGKIVVYAIQSVMTISNTDRPKVSLINSFCTALPYMNPSEIDQVIIMLDSIHTSLLAPSEEYVRMELKVIESLFKYNEGRACERLLNLYIKVDDFQNKSTAVSCKSIILGYYKKLGHSDLIASNLMPAIDLQKEIEADIERLFEKTAYHIKIVEQPLRSLVVDYQSSVEAIISKMNTWERRSRAYMIAADSYIKMVNPNNWEWGYLTGIIDKIDYDLDDRSSVIVHLVNEIVHAKTDDPNSLNEIKKYHKLFFEVERASSKCNVLSNLFVLFKKVNPNDTFADRLYAELLRCWDSEDLIWIKLDNGFLIAKKLAKVSVDLAIEWVKKSSAIQESYNMASASSVTAFHESMELYNKTLGMLIRADLVDKKVLNEFAEIIEDFESEGERIISWSKIALYYYLKNDYVKFDEINTKYIAKSLEGYSDSYKKCIIYNAAPALFLNSKGGFYSRLENYDGLFVDACISRVAKFIFVKYVELEDSEPFQGAYNLDNRDCDNLLDLLEHCVDDNTFFGIFDSLCQSIKSSHTGISLDQKTLLVKRLTSIMNSHLPMKNFIQHDGYKVACSISLSQIDGLVQNKELFEKWESQIKSINNLADQAFLYIHAAHYTSATKRRQQFINNATKIISDIPCTYDKSNRIDFCIDECRKSTTGLTLGAVKQFMEIMYADNNGDVTDIKKAYDSIYDYSPDLANDFLERMDNDPARSYYKAQLLKHSESTKRLTSADTGFSEVTDFSCREQQMFFSKKLANQINKKGNIYDIQSTMGIMKILYKYSISDVHDALGYFLENVIRKQQLSGNLSNLMIGLHTEALVNLKLVLALSSGTKEKMDRINQAISESFTPNHQSLMLAGQKEKSVNYIVNWYKEHPFDNIFIIDAYFSPSDFYILKDLMNINPNLSLIIITHRKNVESLEEYQSGWDRVSSDLTGSITIHTICYDKKSDQGPLHARWWLSINEDEDNRVGIKLNSISGLGVKDEDISDIETDKVLEIEKLAMSYALRKRKKVEEYNLKYESIDIK